VNSAAPKILESPGWKTFFSVVIPVVVGVLSGTFVAEITTSNALNWSAFYKAKSFYGLLTMAAISYFYNRAIYIYERNVERFLDDDYCRAYMRSKCLPEAAEKYKELIRSGEKGELASAMRDFEKILK
jgi:hypothetical protein